MKNEENNRTEYANSSDSGLGVSCVPAGDDLSLISRAKNGDDSAIEEIFVKYRQKIFSVSYRYLHNREDASDIVQETFINAFRYFYKFNAKSGLSTWLVRICLNLGWHRRKSIEMKHFFEISLDKEVETEKSDLTSQFADNCPTPPEEIEKKQEMEGVRSSIDSLKKKYREILILKDLEGYSYHECAKILNISQGTVMSRLHRAREILFKKMSR